MAALQLTPAEWLLAGLLLAVLVLQAWQLLRGGGAERRLRERLADDLGDLMEQRLAARHRELLIDLHDGLSRQTDRIGEHARADRELLQRGLTSASLQLSRGMQALTQSVDGRLDTLSGQVNQRLDEGFRKTNETFASVMARLATIDEAQKKIDGLTTNVVSLQELLGDKRARGAFGEVQLENLVRNMLPPEAFAFQQVLPNGTRVDCLLTLPAPTGNVAVDAKFPLENYHRMFDDALAELDRRAAQQAFRADVKRHVDAISDEVHPARQHRRRRGDVPARRGGVRRAARLPPRGRRLRAAQARVDRVADHADGGAQHRARGDEGRRDAQADPRHPGRARQAREGLPALRRTHGRARPPHRAGQSRRAGRAYLQPQDQRAFPPHRVGAAR